MRIWEYPARERGISDCDQPYRFGHIPSSQWTFPFTTHQFVRLLLLKLRARLEGQLPAADRPDSAPPAEAPTNVAVGGD